MSKVTSPTVLRSLERSRLPPDIQGLRVPIEVTVTTGAVWSNDSDQDLDPLAAQLIATAVATTPSPADLPGTPLDRLNAGRSDVR